MTTSDFPSIQPDSPFFNDIIEFGYHIFNLKKAKIPDYYPNDFPDYSGVSIKELKVGDMITIRVFFRFGSDEDVLVDSGYLYLEIEDIGSDTVLAVILTPLPEEFPLKTWGSIEIFQEEILSKIEQTEHEKKWN